MKKVSLILAFSLLCGSLFAQTPAFVKDSLEAYMLREMQRWQVPGTAVAIIKDGKVVVNQGYGIRDYATKLPVDANTLFQIASNTKAYTATALAMLEAEKRISLQDKVTKHLPYFKHYDPYITKEATVRDLLCHRLGYQTFQGDFLNWDCNLSRRQLIEHMQVVKPVVGFREKYGYCNAAFLAAGEIIPAVTDTTWDDFLKYRLFKPLGMNRTSTQYDSIAKNNNACEGYTVVDKKIQLVRKANVDNLGPAATMNSCTNDMIHWVQMQLDSGKYNGKRVVPFSALQATRQSQIVSRDINSPLFPSRHFQTYGLGWFLEDYDGVRCIEHDGGANGFVTTTWVIPELKLGIVVLTNSDANSLIKAVPYQIIEAYTGKPYRNISQLLYKASRAAEAQAASEVKSYREMVANDVKPSMEIMAYCGNYTDAVYGQMTISLVNKSELKATFEHHPNLSAQLKPMSKNDFLCTYNDPTYGVLPLNFVVKDGRVNKALVHVNGFIDNVEYNFIKE